MNGMVVSPRRDTTKGAASCVGSPRIILPNSEEMILRETVLRRKSEAWKGVVLGLKPHRESFERTCLEGDEVRPIHLVYMFIYLFQVLSTDY